MASSNSLMDSLFQRSLEDLIKGLRLQLMGESAFISKALEEIHREIKSTDLSTKSTALQKLSYLAALHGFYMSWAAFHAVEVVSSARFAHKRIGYHAISQSFNDQTPVLLLITNQLRKDLNSTNEYEVSLALECLSRVGTDDLARDLTPEVFTLLGSSKAFVRKKAIGVVLRVFEKYPDAVRVCFKRLVENLESFDPQILSAAVGVFCELAAKDPRSYLPLAPEFYKILVDSRNNWVLIKILKIFAKLALIEPRLAKKVVEPICEHMRRTGAKSLVFECIRTVVSSLSEYEPALKLAVAKIREFLVDDDPNLKYLGLHALSIVAPNHLWAVLENKEVVIKALSDEDPNVKLEALHLLMAMVSENNVSEISRVLVNYALKSDPLFCNEIIGSILSACSMNLYEIIFDFDWYVSLLGEMARIPHCQRGEEIERQLIDIGMRVKDARPELVRVGRALLIDPALLGNPFLSRIVSAAAWVSGEWVEFSKDPFEIAEALLQPRTCLLPPFIRAVYVQAVFKVLVFCLRSYFLNKEIGVDSLSSVHDAEEPYIQEYASGPSVTNGFTYESIANLLNRIEFGLGPLCRSHDVEVQERAKNVLGFIGLIKQEIMDRGIARDREIEVSRAIGFVEDVFSEELGPASESAQERISVPDGLDLKENLEDLQEICGEFLQPVTSNSDKIDISLSNLKIREEPEASSRQESTSLLAEHRRRHGLYYLPSEKSDINNGSNDYPPANDNLKDGAGDLVNELTAESFNPKSRQNQSKRRPVVVKLDDGAEMHIVAKKPELKEDSLSGAIRNVLLGKEKEKESSEVRLDPKQNLGHGDTKPGDEEQGSSRRKHHSRKKERKGKEKNPEGSDEERRKEKQKRRKHRSRRRAEEELPPSQPTVVPDFLL